jgi:hypothetical protein
MLVPLISGLSEDSFIPDALRRDPGKAHSGKTPLEKFKNWVVQEKLPAHNHMYEKTGYIDRFVA